MLKALREAVFEGNLDEVQCLLDNAHIKEAAIQDILKFMKKNAAIDLRSHQILSLPQDSVLILALENQYLDIAELFLEIPEIKVAHQAGLETSAKTLIHEHYEDYVPRAIKATRKVR